jgi:hypothetical protein
MEEKDLTKMTVTRLREEAKKYTSIEGVSVMKKEDLIKAIADARGEPVEIKKKKSRKKKKEVDVADLKKKIKTLRKEKAEGRKSKSRKETNRLRRKIKELKRHSRKFGKEKAEAIAAAKKGGKEAAPAAAAPAPAPAAETASADAPKIE